MDFVDYGLKVSLKGVENITVAAGQEVSSQFTASQRTLLTGAEYFREGNIEDTVSFKVKVNGQVVSTFAENIFMGLSGRYEFYQAILQNGYVVEVTYKNNGTNEAKFRFNLITHIDK